MHRKQFGVRAPLEFVRELPRPLAGFRECWAPGTGEGR